MNTSAIILLSLVWGFVISLTVYFFVIILNAPKKEEPDSYTENDEEVGEVRS